MFDIVEYVRFMRAFSATSLMDSINFVGKNSITGAQQRKESSMSKRNDSNAHVVHTTTYKENLSPYSTFAGNRRAEVVLSDGRTGWDNGRNDTQAIAKAIRHARSK